MLKIVIVEDEDLLREGLVSCINWEELGFVIGGVARDGREALEIIKQKRPELVLTDIRMPFFDGIEMTEKLKQDYPDIKVVILSGYDEFEYARRALKAGVSEYILKPIKIKHLKNIMGSMKAKIDEEKNMKWEINKLKNIEKQSIKSMKENLFTKLLIHKKTIGEQENEINILKEEVDNKYYSVGIIERRDFPMLSINCDYLEIMKLDSEFESIINNRLRSYPQIECIRDNNCERLLCMSGSSAEEVRVWIKELINLFDSEKEEEIDATLSFGHVYKELEGLFNSFLSAKKIREINYVRVWESILNQQKSADLNIKYMNYNAQKLFHEIRSGTRATIDNEIENLAKELLNEKVVSHMHLILIISNLYFSLIQLPEELGVDVNTILGDPMETYHEIVSKFKQNEILKELKEVCYQINIFFKSVQGSKMQVLIKRITEYMKKEFVNEGLSMKDVADNAYISVSYLSIILKKETGKTFIEYLTEIRIDQAKNLLTETNLKNYEVAEACGYSNPTYFSTVFKSITGESPSSYRKLNITNIG